MNFKLPAGILIDEMNQRYVSAQPFPHIVLDGLIDHCHLYECYLHFPYPDGSWWKYDNPLERKYAKNDLLHISPSIRELIYELNSNIFVSFLERLTGIKGLIVDHTLNGGGLHQIAQGGKLDIHADYNIHPITKLDRRVNVLLYLNHEWSNYWGGELELWDANMESCKKKISPFFNRMVIFSSTDFSFHGHPEPLRCPEGMTRKSIALYYYTNGRPEQEMFPAHSTLYQKRPGDPEDPTIEQLRQKRAMKRL